MTAASNLDGRAPDSLDALADMFDRLDDARRADLAEHAQRLLEQQKGENE